jgi:AMMECR1 domain-containing protein
MVPVQAAELADLEIEITVLGPLESIAAGSAEELLSQLRPGVDGLLLESREGGAVFIPAVWRQLPEPRAFLEALLRKAQLRRWPPDLRAFRFPADEVSSATVEA